MNHKNELRFANHGLRMHLGSVRPCTRRFMPSLVATSLASIRKPLPFRQCNRSARGFTLIEILIALFIFSIVSVMLAGGLRTVINAQSGTEDKAERLRQLQMALLIFSRDVEQAVNRPIISAYGREDAAFIGTSKSFTFTHTGFANPTGIARSSLQRTGYSFAENSLWRYTWPVLDQVPQTVSYKRELMREIPEGSFQYLDADGRFRDEWPASGDDSNPLPLGIRVFITVGNWGTISQLYLIPASASKSVEFAAKTSGKTGADRGEAKQQEKDME